ncbi:ATP-binding protein [Anaerobacillus alkalidiazotrophicus]|nr:ATP-binding protein [Anaerobacillus alkalidiazotrophicus]
MKTLKIKVSQVEKLGGLSNQTNQPNGTNMSTFNCVRCEDRGLILEKNSDGYEVGIPCYCNKKRKVERLMASSEITDKFLKLGFGNFETEGRPQVIEIAKTTAIDYVDAFDDIKRARVNSLTIVGTPGSGKTHLQMAVANNLIKMGIPVLYFPFVEGFNDLKRNFDLLDKKIEKMKQIDVLFIDDLFKGRDTATQFQMEQIYAVVNYRYLNHLPILLSSEKTIDEICYIDEALGSRIFEMSQDYLVQIKGDRMSLNYRLKALLNKNKR